MKPVKNTILPLPRTKEEYCQFELGCGLQHGDLVKIIRKAETHEHGWGNAWIEEMDEYIGKSFRMDLAYASRTYASGRGIRIEDFFFPYFVLEKIKER